MPWKKRMPSVRFPLTKDSFMFTTYYSDSLETLARIGGVIMKNMRGSADLFVNEVIVTQNRGMFTYVKQVMTEQNGIFAGIWPGTFCRISRRMRNTGRALTFSAETP